jgi:WYL domain
VPEAPHSPPAHSGARRARWSEEKRLEFIDFRLRWEGRFNRSDLTDFFGISVPQASIDIARYLQGAPGNATYDRAARAYVASDAFVPVYLENDPSRYMNELFARASGLGLVETSFLGWAPPVELTPVPHRRIEVGTILALLRAVREHLGLRIIYQSMDRPEPTSRTISPHAFGHDGLRWHARAFCHTRGEFRDFVVGRILQVEGLEPQGADPTTDLSWHSTVSLELCPNPALSEGGRRAVELDYGMTNGRVTLKCRKALQFYLEKRLGLEKPADGAPDKRQVVIATDAALRMPAPLETKTTSAVERGVNRAGGGERQ